MGVPWDFYGAPVGVSLHFYGTFIVLPRNIHWTSLGLFAVVLLDICFLGMVHPWYFRGNSMRLLKDFLGISTGVQAWNSQGA